MSGVGREEVTYQCEAGFVSAEQSVKANASLGRCFTQSGLEDEG